MLEVRSLHYQRHGQAIISDLNLQVNPGHMLILMGPNGSGKSTCLKLLAGLLKPSSGSVAVQGVDLSLAPGRQLGYLGQTASLYPHLSPHGQLCHWAGLQGLEASVIPERVTQLLEQFNLEKVQHRRSAELSKGQQQALGLAQAILHQPKVLLLDEPTASLDPWAQRAFIDLMMTLRADMAVVMASHHLHEFSAQAQAIMMFQAHQPQVLGPMSLGDYTVWLQRHEQVILTQPSNKDATDAATGTH